jgi:hypothetical protein
MVWGCRGGEAATCFAIKEWATFAGSWWISDDREALRYARFHGIATYETFDLMSTADGPADQDAIHTGCDHKS